MIKTASRILNRFQSLFQLFRYEILSRQVFGQNLLFPHRAPACSWTAEDKWGLMVHEKMQEVDYAYAEHLLEEQQKNGITGDIVEFGIFEGRWIEQFYQITQKLGMSRTIYGFDSFEGLPDVSTKDDLGCWVEGDYKSDFDSVSASLKTSERPNIHLVKGWFSQSLPRPEIQAIQKIAYARIDCDLYGPSVECLDWLRSRLVDGALLVFDDWTYRPHKGETKAFFEWQRSVKTSLKFEFLAYNNLGQFYIKVHHIKGR